MNRISGVQDTKSITFEQFSALLRAKMDMNLEESARRRFDHFDADQSGEISMDELKKCIQSMDDLVTGAEIAEMLKICDTDHNGSVSFNEFLSMMPAFFASNMDPATSELDAPTPGLDDDIPAAAVAKVAA
jgi:Ca2+-binding EF-hand superfamily protein